MNDQRKPGRPKKHLQDEHHYRTADNDASDGAPSVASDAAQESASETLSASETTASALSEPITGGSGDGRTFSTTVIDGMIEAVVENPTEFAAQETVIAPVISSIDQEPACAAKNAEIIESPIEQKIHNLVDGRDNISVWHPMDTEIVLQIPPRNGMPVKLSEKPDGEGVLAFWKKTRKFANITHRWQEGGKWVNFNTGLDISFQPKYWKERF